MFYLKITMLMLSLLLFVVFVCLLHNDPPTSTTPPPAVKLWFKLSVIIIVFIDTMSVPHAR